MMLERLLGLGFGALFRVRVRVFCLQFLTLISSICFAMYIRFGFENSEKESKKVLSVCTTMRGLEVCEEEPEETGLITRRRCGRIDREDDEEETTKWRCRTCCTIDENDELM
jgi:hypothetical protein